MRSHRGEFILFTVLVLIIFLAMYITRTEHGKWIQESIAFRAKIIIANLEDTFNPPRKPSMKLAESEARLEMQFPDVFGQFSRQEWNWFWKLIYARFVMDEPPVKFCPKRRRHLTKEEVEEQLATYYPKPFSRFREPQWDIFWQKGLQMRFE